MGLPQYTEAEQLMLRRSGLSPHSELSAARLARLRELVGSRSANAHEATLRSYIMGWGSTTERPPRSGQEGGHSMPATKSKKQVPTKAVIGKIAGMRRDGATWDEVIAETGVKTNSTGFRELLEANGFDKLGVKKGSAQKSKARGWGSASNGASAKATKKPAAKKTRRVKKTKATVEK